MRQTHTFEQGSFEYDFIVYYDNDAPPPATLQSPVTKNIYLTTTWLIGDPIKHGDRTGKIVAIEMQRRPKGKFAIILFCEDT
jgi:hypothetical protein